MTSAAIRSNLIIRQTKAVIKRENDKIDKLETKRVNLRKKYEDKFAQRLWLFRVFADKTEYIESKMEKFFWNAYDSVNGHKRNIRTARGILMLANQAQGSVVQLSASDALFLNIDPDV